MNPWIALPTFLATLAWVGVVVIYWSRATWWKSAVGINTMGISLTLALILIRLTLLQAGVVFSPPGNIMFGTGSYLGVAFFGFQRMYLIWDSQARKARQIARGEFNRRWDDPR